ncbi:1817_t:CDS:2 [Dentiscutata erythropus]|uniref:1817_t:CDS:1 n=1 Tax=Dentiscutata erythropus TaxID=1348616 RepID=A0A9N9HRB3_9GLOM|nr:1817_t:CDS:2 [Dentiscutata erythropus]
MKISMDDEPISAYALPEDEEDGKDYQNHHIQIFAKIFTDETIPLEVIPSSDTIGSVKKQIQKQIGNPPHEQKCSFVCVITPDEKTLELDVLPTDTIKELKQKIWEDFKHYSSRHFKYKGDKLENECILFYTRIRLLRLEYSFQVFVRGLDGKTMVFEVNSFGAIVELKRLIEDATGIPPDQQRLIFSGKQLDDDNKLSDYGIIMRSTISLVFRLCALKLSDLTKFPFYIISKWLKLSIGFLILNIELGNNARIELEYLPIKNWICVCFYYEIVDKIFEYAQLETENKFLHKQNKKIKEKFQNRIKNLESDLKDKIDTENTDIKEIINNKYMEYKNKSQAVNKKLDLILNKLN